ncbi:MAG: GNAT family N-acetyltransferase [Trueperaceae bacterium]|nr:GNAT family N-acetyltransferase [Trueperaceae bacterium]
MSAGKALPSDAVLTGELVRLEPLTWEHVPALLEIAYAYPDEFRLTSTPTNDAEAEAYFGAVLRQRAAGEAHPVAVVDGAGRVVGTSRLSEVNFKHRRCELGFSWYDPALFQSGVNIESKLLLLTFAFEALGLLRVQIHTDTRNVRSQRAILALGARFEGVLRRHQVAKDGYVRDTMVYAITDLDWPEVEARLRERLARRLARSGHAA